MWKGIEVQPGGSIEIVNSLLEDAEIAVALGNNSVHKISLTYFNKNNIGIAVAGYSGTNNSQCFIKSSLFTVLAPSRTLNLTPWIGGLASPNNFALSSYPVTNMAGNNTIPQNTVIGKSGIEFILNSATFTVGVIGGGAGANNLNTNIFDNVSRGIYNNFSKVNIVNNKFQSISFNANNPAEAGIRTVGGYLFFPIMGVTQTNIGNGNTNGQNSFGRSLRGVWASNFQKLTIDKNNFSLFAAKTVFPFDGGEGILFEKWGSGSATVNNVVIQKNNFSNAKTAISGFSNTQVFASIYDNDITNSNILNSPVGISLQEINPINSVRYYVANNQNIQNVFIGILCNNLNGGTFKSNIFYNNKILSSIANSTALAYDILMTNCKGITIYNNTLKTNGLVSAGNITNFGIYASDCNAMTIQCNDIDGTGVPLKFTGPASLSGANEIVGNNIANGTYGVWLDNGANIGDIADLAGNAGDNLWGNFTSGCYSQSDNGANSNGFKILYRTPGNSAYNPSGFACQMSATQMPKLVAPGINPAYNVNCSPPPIANPGGANGNINALVDLINNTFTYPSNDAEFKLIGKKNLLHSLKEGFINPNANVAFLNFEQANQNSVMGKFFNADSLLNMALQSTGATDVSSAYQINTGITTQNLIESYHQQINDLYIKYIQNATLSLNEVNQVRNIAQLCPFTEGSSVYKARALLSAFDSTFYINSCETEGQNNNQKISIKKEENQKEEIYIYPNPANETVTIFIPVAEEETVSIELVNMLGEKIRTVNLKLNAGQVNFDCNGIKSGVYSIRIMNKNTLLKEEKLILIK